MKPLFEYFAASRVELSKVTWPNRRATARITFQVIVFSLLFAAFMGVLDLLFTTLVQKVIVKG